MQRVRSPVDRDSDHFYCASLLFVAMGLKRKSVLKGFSLRRTLPLLRHA